MTLAFHIIPNYYFISSLHNLPPEMYASVAEHEKFLYLWKDADPGIAEV